MAQYLPVLLVSVSAVSATNPAPDDSSLDAQAAGQVDYLSHEWQEEDVAKSWRNMTRRKDSIQNGARLENASWRTWWKQRNNLPTVSPETLNWLKDSDVTWLYGPLHTAADWMPPPRHTPSPGSPRSSPTSPTPTSASLSPPTLQDNAIRSRSSRSNFPWALKPILKHRSISELLSISFSSSPGSDHMELVESQDYSDASDNAHTNMIASATKVRDPRDVTESGAARKRPKLTHTKSDTNVHRRNPFRGDSPPLPLIPDGQALPSLGSALRPLSTQSRDSSCGDGTNGQKRHISFNTFVEQCIAIEKPDKLRDRFHGVDDEDDGGFGVHDEEGYREYEEESDNEEDESEDDVLEMRPNPRSRCFNRRTPSLSGTSSSSASGYAGLDLSNGSEREHITIAPIAPTMLKTSTSPSPSGSFHHGGSGSIWEEEEEEEEEAIFLSRHSYSASASTTTERTDTVNLVYVPPQGSVYAEQLSMNGTSIDGHAVSTRGSTAFLRTSPPQASAVPRASSFDDELFTGRRREDVELGPPFDSGFDFFGGSELGGISENGPYRPVSMSRSGRGPAQPLRASASDLSCRVASDIAPGQLEEEEVLSVNSKGSSGSVSEDNTVVPPFQVPQRSSQGEAESPPPVVVSSYIVSSGASAAIPVPRHHHVQQLPSPAPSSTSTGTSSVTSAGSGSANSYGSPFLEPPAREHSISPVTSPLPNGDLGRGRSAKRGSSISLSDMDRAEREKDDREPQRGRSRSRSIGAGSPLDGSISPRGGGRGRLSRRASIDGGGGIGLGGLGTAYGLGASPSSRDQSLSPEDNDGTRKGGRVRSRAKRSDKNGEASMSPPNVVSEPDIVVSDDPAAAPQATGISTEPPQDATAEQALAGDTDSSRSQDVVYDKPPTPPPFKVSDPSPVAKAFPIPTIPTSTIHTPDESTTLVGRAVTSAKGYLGSFWGPPPHRREGSSVSSA